MRSLFLLILLTGIIPCTLLAQHSSTKPMNHSIGILPQYAFINGFRTEFDFRLKKEGPNWLVVSPQVFMSRQDPLLYNYDKMWGLGLELQQRRYLGKESQFPKGLYIGYGPLFQFFSIDDNIMHSEKVTENGIDYWVVKNGPVTTNIYKAGLTLTAGYQAVALNVLYFDFFLGTGIRMSFDNRQPSGLADVYNEWWGSHAYSGTLITMGLRVGMFY